MDAKLRDLAAKGLIRASVVVSPFTIGGVPQSLTYRLDQRDGPRISVHSSVHKTKSGEVEYSQKRFHLNDPDIFPDIEAQPSLPPDVPAAASRSEEHTSELQSLMRISYAVFCLKKKKNQNTNHTQINTIKQ